MIGFYENDDDLLAIARIHIENQKNVYRGILQDEYLDSLNIEDSFCEWKTYSKKDDRDILVYRYNDEVVAFAGVKFYVSDTYGGLLTNLHVKKEMQGHGIGKSLIKASAGLLLNMNIKSMQIAFIEGNVRAEYLYKSMGAVEKPEFQKENHHQLLWDDLSDIADLGVSPRKKFNYENIMSLSNQKFILFGAGEYCDVFMNFYPMLRPTNIFDNDIKKHGTQKNEILIIPPEKADNVVIVSCYYQEIEEQLKMLGCKNIMKFYPWHNYKTEYEI